MPTRYHWGRECGTGFRLTGSSLPGVPRPWRGTSSTSMDWRRSLSRSLRSPTHGRSHRTQRLRDDDRIGASASRCSDAYPNPVMRTALIVTGGTLLILFLLLVSLDRKSTRLNSSHVAISDAVFCLKKKKEPQG